jgi:hypothetical protein
VIGALGDLGRGAKTQVCEFLRTYAGPKSSFLKEAEAAAGFADYIIPTLTGILDSYIEYLIAGIAGGRPPERRAQLDVVSDVLTQAQAMLDDNSIHPAAPAVVIGASLEEFLRTWVEASSLSIGSAKPSIDAYAKALRAADYISKQDMKDISSWAGVVCFGLGAT